MEVNSPATEPTDDEYDNLNVSIDPEFMPYIIDLPTSQEVQETSPHIDITSAPDTRTSPKSTHSDEYSKYDLSEFTAEELAAFDDQITFTKYETTPRANHPHFGNLSSGPAIEIEIEKSADAPIGGQKSAEGVPFVATQSRKPSIHLSPKPASTDTQRYTQTSPFHRFRWRRKTLAVTDLSSPVWCEVQWEYSLLGKRHRKIEERPESFVSTAGKVIHVDQAAAATLDKTSKEGTKVHKALEREIHPKKVKVAVATEEENWALRILQMVDCIQSLITLGRCREMPVFGILQGQAVVGIIDEIRREPAPDLPSSRSSSSSPSRRRHKREREREEINPVSPSKPKSKKTRRSPSPSQPTITTFFNRTLNTNADSSHAEPNTRPSTPSNAEPNPMSDSHPHFRLYISDTKSRRTATLPPKEDQEPAYLQLMIYHRLLSNILANSSTALLAFWRHASLSRSLKFSEIFKAKAGLSDVMRLMDLEPILRNAVEMLHVDGVDDKLQIVYRTQVTLMEHTPRKRKGKGEIDGAAISGESTTLKPSSSKEGQKRMFAVDEEAFADLDQAKQSDVESGATGGVERRNSVINSSVFETPILQAEAIEAAAKATTQANMVELDVEDESTIPNGPKDAAEEAAEIPAGAGVPVGRSDSSSDTDSDGECADVRQRSQVLGTKEFLVDNVRLDAHISSVLDLWYGKRQPVGVETALTRRCGWCQYHDGCEWRELKAEEALAKRRIPPEASSSNA
ncbi:hypothetical protein PHLGIDRAFT_115786 [Phlebiopsis gigantea 11061_1 CR5-6]|uniref:Exonuclease V n=1 Tax=Phlebiopsis gigantea (strain 11061_1 CR5-6) TaxID=745531 RepID=A0A0C3SE25_PHLG1|nr:hypothetical protein PHLGIDRAFT_115786 [Phlebiopsis gigantea 11061_1 CR5-6]